MKKMTVIKTLLILSFKQHIQKMKQGISAFVSMSLTLLLCITLPTAQASDREIYSTAVNSNITVMLALDQSLSMSLKTWSVAACDAPDGYTEVTWTGDNSNGKDVFSNPHAVNHVGKTYTYDRYFCTAKPPIIKSRAIWKKINNSYWDIRYQMCTNNAARYEDCVWGAETPNSAKPSNSGSLVYYLPGTSGYQLVWVWYDKNSTKVKLYDRMTRVKDAIYELLYGDNALDGEKGVGLSLFPVSAAQASKGHIKLPARPLKEIVGTTNQRDLLMQAVAAMGPMGLTPTTNVYADIAAYFFGTNTLRRPLQNLVAVQRIEWKMCQDGYGHRTSGGACKDWYYSRDSWFTTGLPTAYSSKLDINTLEEKPLSVCQQDLDDSRDLVGMTNCYTTQKTIPRYVMAMPLGETDTSKALWRTCVSWKENGLCNDDTYWRPDGASTALNYLTWSKTKPSDTRLIPDFSVSGLTTAQKSAAYVKISNNDYDCPTTGLNIDSSYKITCFGDVVDAPAFAVKRIINPVTYDTNSYHNYNGGGYGKIIDPGSPNGVWKTCTGGNDSDGTCKVTGFTPWIPSYVNGSIYASTDGNYPNNYSYWSNVKPSVVTDDLETSFCSNFDLDLVPGNETGATGICYFSTTSTFQKHIFASFYSGFIESANESKDMTNTDVLQQTYKRPAAIQAQINSAKQCSGQGIYILTDGEANATAPAIETALYRAALTTTSTIATARNFNCSNPDFGGSNTMWGCAANFSRILLNTNSSLTNPINMPIRTATFGFGGDYADLPSYDDSKTTSENAATIKDFYGVSDYIKGLALLGIYGKGGWYKGASTEEILASIKSFFANFTVDIPSLNSGTVTIPVDALNPTQIQNYAYYPEFQPKPDSSYPLWLGNMKKFAVANGILVDKDGSSIVDSNGNVKADLSDLWKGTDTLAGALGKIPLRGTSGRKLLINQEKITVNNVDQYQPTTTGTSANNYGFSTITADYLNSTDSKRGYLLALLGYSLSQAQAELPAQIDSSILESTPLLRRMGAAIHSTPILLTQSGTVTYDSTGNATTNESTRDEYLGFGTQQGLFQVVDAKTGIEKFAFVPYEMFEKQKKGFLDSSLVSDATGVYNGIDAPWAAYTSYVSNGRGALTVGNGINGAKGKQWVYGGLRMGGRSYYSLDLSDINVPKLKFWINPEGAATNSAISYMGQSWSKPTLAYVNWKGARKLVMFVGGGYDSGYESDSYDQTNGVGAGVYMFDADNGALLWWASSNPVASSNTGTTNNALKVDNMSYSVVGRINTVDRNADGLVDHLYFGDLGGQVWRVDINNTVTGNDSQFAKRAVRLLNLHASNGISPRFYEAPNVSVYSGGNNGRFAAISIGSGNRSLPLSAQYSSSTAAGRVNDALYVIYDKDIARTDLYSSPSTPITLVTQDLTLANLAENTSQVTGNEITYTNNNGWYYRFSSTNIQSAKVLGELTSINKNLYVAVYDAAQDGVTGTCGTGLKGTTTAYRFCLPYGKCTTGTVDQNKLELGSGILGITVGSGSSASSLQVIGGKNTVTDGINSSKLKDEIKISRSLAPKQWYEINAK